MFAKLLKHKFKSNQGIFTILSLAAFGAGLLGGGMLWLIRYWVEVKFPSAAMPVYSIFISLAGLTTLGCGISIFAYYLSIFIVQIVQFYRQHFSDEGYLTFTLPATTHQHLLSSILSIILWTVISSVVTAISAGSLLLPLVWDEFVQGDFSILRDIWESFVFMFSWDENVSIALILSAFANSAYGLMLPLTAITIGALISKKHKVLAAFGLYYGINMALSIVVGVLRIFFIIPFADSILYDSSNILLVPNLINAFLYFGIAIGGYFLMHHLMDKKLNLQ